MASYALIKYLFLGVTQFACGSFFIPKTLGGLAVYVRVRDKRTGHELDVLSTDKRIGGAFQPVEKAGYPDSPYPRAAKHNPLPSTAKSAPVKPEKDVK